MTDLLQNKTRIVSDVSVKLHSSELIFTLAADNIYFSPAAMLTKPPVPYDLCVPGPISH